jgi:hypothetical protein
MDKDDQLKIASQILSDGLKMSFRPYPTEDRLRQMSSVKDIPFIQNDKRTYVADSVELFKSKMTDLGYDHFILNFDTTSSLEQIIKL